MKTTAELIKEHEGFRHYVYKCTEGKSTIGYGRNIDCAGGRGISKEEAEMLLRNDIIQIRQKLGDALFFFAALDHVRQTVLVSMMYNMGFRGIISFKKMIIAIIDQNYDLAADEMLDSKWAKQVPGRAKALSELMRVGHTNA